MRPAERRQVKRAKLLVKTGDRAGALRLLSALEEPPREKVDPADQLVLPMLDARFECLALCSVVTVGVCIARQAATDCQRTTQTSRGQGTAYPSCDSRKCAQGRHIRERFDPDASAKWTWEGPVKLYGKGRANVAAQEAAKRRIASVGLLDEVPTLDGIVDAVQSDD
jgi:hypothetical protein